MHYCKIYVDFWLRVPALLYGVTLLFAAYSFFYGFSSIVIPLIFFVTPFLIFSFTYTLLIVRHSLLIIFLFLTFWFYLWASHSLPELPSQGIKGKAWVTINAIRVQTRVFGPRWNYECLIHHFYPEDENLETFKKIKCSLSFAKNEKIQRPPVNHHYLISGTLIKNPQGAFFLKVSPVVPWQIIKENYSFVEKRYQWKNDLNKWIRFHHSSPLSAAFLSGLATGDFDDPWLHREFARFGLQHIMAISGFHFTIIMSLCALILRLFFTQKTAAGLLIFLMSGYAFFLGLNPSIMRAWIMCILVLIAAIIKKRSTSLNTLGVALCGVILYDPSFCQTIGFQFSFLITTSILLFYASIERLLHGLFTKKSLHEVIEMSFIDQHGYCILVFLRKSLALLLAVNLFAVPLTLYYFQQFPWISLIYNLFFPFLITISLVLLMINLLVMWIPLISEMINQVNNHFTDGVLKLTYEWPTTLEYFLFVSDLSLSLLLSYFSLIFLLGIVGYRNNDESNPYFLLG